MRWLSYSGFQANCQFLKALTAYRITSHPSVVAVIRERPSIAQPGSAYELLERLDADEETSLSSSLLVSRRRQKSRAMHSPE